MGGVHSPPMGSLRFRRSMKLGGGLRFSVSKTGLGLSAGVRGARYSVHTSGRTTRSVGIPGTGVGYVSQSGGGSGRRSRGSPQSRGAVAPDRSGPTQAQLAALLPKPGLFAGRADRDYYAGVQAYVREDFDAALRAFDAASLADSQVPSAHLFAATCASILERPGEEAIRHLEAVVGSEEPMPDRMQAKYLPLAPGSLTLQVKITDHIQAAAAFDAIGATLALAERYQDTGRLEEAIGLVQQLHDTAPDDPGIRLSLADLLYADGDYEGTLEVASGAANDSDLGVSLLHLRGAAMAALGHTDGALEAFREALSKTADRDPDLLKVVRYDRALTFTSAGQAAKAKADFERIYAVDPTWEDVKERLSSM